MRDMSKNCSIFYVANKQRLVLQCRHENPPSVMGDPTCRLSSLTSPEVVGKFIMLIAEESIKYRPQMTDEAFKEVTSSTIKLVGFGRWNQMEKETDLCMVWFQDDRAIVAKWIRASERQPKGRGYEPSKDVGHQINCPLEPSAIGQAVFRLFDIKH